VFSARHRRGNAGAQLLLVVATGDIIYLSESLKVDILGWIRAGALDIDSNEYILTLRSNLRPGRLDRACP
jgi:hypothetical protein